MDTMGARERVRWVGVEGLSDAELLSLLLGTGTAREPVAVLSERLLSELGGLSGLARRGLGALETATGLGPTKAMRILAAMELGRRVGSQPLARGRRVRSSRDIYAAVGPRLAALDVEHFLAIALDGKRRPVAEITIARGSLSACPVSPADVFRALLREAASAVVFVHNHPSGETSPSPEDMALTRRLEHLGELLGLRVLDHLIVGRESYFSFLDSGLMNSPPLASSP